MNRILLFLSCFVALVGCNKITSVAPGMVNDAEIVFGADGPGFSAEVFTKASPVTALTSVNVVASTGSAGSESLVWNSAFSQDASDASTYRGSSESKWWPSTSVSYLFSASNLPLIFNAAGSTVSASNSTDVVCAYLPSSVYKTKNTLVFQHIFARLGTVTLTSTGGYTISGVSVMLTPKVSGTYNLRTGAGKTDGTGWSSTDNGTAVNIASNTGAAKENDIYLVPGVYELSATWTATKGNFTKTYSNMRTTVSLVAGKINTISGSLTGDATELVFSVSLQPWANNSITGVTFPLE